MHLAATGAAVPLTPRRRSEDRLPTIASLPMLPRQKSTKCMEPPTPPDEPVPRSMILAKAVSRSCRARALDHARGTCSSARRRRASLRLHQRRRPPGLDRCVDPWIWPPMKSSWTISSKSRTSIFVRHHSRLLGDPASILDGSSVLCLGTANAYRAHRYRSSYDCHPPEEPLNRHNSSPIHPTHRIAVLER